MNEKELFQVIRFISGFSNGYGPARLGAKIEKWSDLDKNFRVYVTFDVGSESEVRFSVFS